MPWLTGTAFLHSVMIQEKKGMLKVWNVLLVILTFSLSIFGTFLTRSGIISSVHAFATSDIGPAFGIFLFVVFFGSLILLITRLDSLKSEARLESVLSRESSFLFNNMIFVGMAATVLLLTTFPMLSEAVTGRKVTMGPPIFNLVNVPWALVLLLLAGVGPLIAWRKATRANLQRNFMIPGLLGIWVLLALLVLDVRAYISALGGIGRSIVGFDVAGIFRQRQDLLSGVDLRYRRIRRGNGRAGVLPGWPGPGQEPRRVDPGGARPARLAQQNVATAGTSCTVGVVVIFLGVAASSAYQKEAVGMLNPGEMLTVDDYLMRYEGYTLEAVDDHLGAVTEISVFDRASGDPLGTLTAEQRFHPNMMVPDLREAFNHTKQLGAEGSEKYAEATLAMYGLIQRLEKFHRREVKTPVYGSRHSGLVVAPGRGHAWERTSTSFLCGSIRRPGRRTFACSSTRWSTSSGWVG